MRKKEREIKDMKEIESIILSTKVCRVAFSDGDQPYIVPLCFGYRNNALYFHAQWRRTNPLTYGTDYTMIEGVEGQGQYVGAFMAWQQNNAGWWGEGEIKMFLDDDREFPTICGTGTEDYFCGSYCFIQEGKYKEYTTPYAGLTRT